MWKRDGVWLPWAYEFCLMISNLRLVERRNAEGTCCRERGRRLAVEGRGPLAVCSQGGPQVRGRPLTSSTESPQMFDTVVDTHSLLKRSF